MFYTFVENVLRNGVPECSGVPAQMGLHRFDMRERETQLYFRVNSMVGKQNGCIRSKWRRKCVRCARVRTNEELNIVEKAT